MISLGTGGRLGALLLLLSWAARAQISVINGLAHFHPCGDPSLGEIVVANTLDSAVRVFLEVEHPVEHPHNAIPSEWILEAGQRAAIPYHWLDADSSSQAVRVWVYSTLPQARAEMGTWTVQTQIRYAISLFRGCLTTSPERDVRADWGNTLTWQMVGPDFWSAQVQAYGSLGEAIQAPFDLFLTPFGTSVSQPLPHGTSFVVARDSRGYQIGCKRP